MNDISETELNRKFLKNLFKEILQSREPYPVDTLDNMGMILADIFLKEFGSGNIPTKILKNHENIEEWLDEQIENV